MASGHCWSGRLINTSQLGILMAQVKLEVRFVENIIERLEETIDMGQSSPGIDQEELVVLIKYLETAVATASVK
jgi:hypothetical protein